MTSGKQRKRRRRQERLRVEKSTKGPRRPYTPPRPSRPARERFRQLLLELGSGLAQADAEGQRLLKTDYSALRRLMESSASSESRLICQASDGSLVSELELSARHPGYERIILPPREGTGDSEEPSEAPGEPGALLDPIIEYPIEGARGWRLALVPPSRIHLIPLPERTEEDDDAC